MATPYTTDQVDSYLAHIDLGTFTGVHEIQPEDQLDRLQVMQRFHIASVPFENIALHYSPSRLLSLDAGDLFEKIVVKGRGGYCMEVNALFGDMLRSLGYAVVSVGGRVKHKKWNHMVNIVTIRDQKYLVDVGFGAKEPTQPVPLLHGHEFPVLGETTGRLEFKHLAKHSLPAKQDNSQRVWVYSTRPGADGPWDEMYSFTEAEFFPDDFEMMSYALSTRPDSWFVQEVVAYRAMLGEGLEVAGEMTLRGNTAKRRLVGEEAVVITMASEKHRVKVLEKFFGIELSEREQRAIVGLVSELKDQAA